MSDQTLAEVTLGHLRAMGITPAEGPAEDIWTFEAGGAPGAWNCFVWVRQAEAQVVLHSVAPFGVPAARREAVALYLTRANYGLILGNFEFDLDDGELRFKTSVDVEGTTLAETTMRHLVGVNLKAMDQYLGGALEVIAGTDPATAVAAAESAG